MAQSLMEMPSDILLLVLSFLPVRALLRFSRTCRYSHSLANSSLHTLSLSIYSTRVSAFISRVSSSDQPRPKHEAALFTLFDPTSSPSSALQSPEDSEDDEGDFAHNFLDGNDPHKVSVLIKEGRSLDYNTLLIFHTALTRSILTRHGAVLRNLDLSLWTLTMPVAKTIAELSALRVLSIRIEGFPPIRAVPRSYITAQQASQHAAWDLLAENAVWAPRLHALRVENGTLDEKQLFTLLRRSRYCRELWLSKCGQVGGEVWSFLGVEWEGRAALRVLGLVRCGGQPNSDMLDLIGRGTELQSLTVC